MRPARAPRARQARRASPLLRARHGGEVRAVEVPFVRTDDNLADFFTKPFKEAKKFYAMRRKIMNEPSA